VTGELSGAGEVAPVNLYDRLIADLDGARARYRVIDHAPEGRTEIVSAMRGHQVEEAAKCLVVMVKLTKKQSHYVLAVVPGDARVDFPALKALFGGGYVALAEETKAEQLAGSPKGTILPFSYHPELELIADPGLLGPDELYFNAARLDRSIALATADYLRLASPRMAPIARRS
jgi:Ala-tRNA(Pro) deacylase